MSRRVLGVVGQPDNAVRYVRFHQPFERLHDRGFELVTLGSSLTLNRAGDAWEPGEELLDDVSILMFPQIVLSPRLADGSRVRLVEPLCRAARRRGIPIVYSPDDYLPRIEPGNPSFDRVAESAENVEAMLSFADALIVTTEQLRRTLEPWGRPTYVLPNAIDPARIRNRPRRSGELRVGWAGSSSHVDDLLMVLPAIRELQRRIPVKLVLYGLVEQPIERVAADIPPMRGLTPAQRVTAERFLELVDELRSIDYLHEPFGPLDAYFERLPALDFDIGICPLLDTSFNRHKSALKFYEYAACGTLTVASHVGPYRDEVSVTVDNSPTAWTEALENLLRDVELREHELGIQREFVFRERNIDTLNVRWAEALTSIAGLGTSAPAGQVGGTRATVTHDRD